MLACLGIALIYFYR
ncbi:MAG: hypothetical protein AB1629_05605 [Candidatus Omnitrophota bacterium]